MNVKNRKCIRRLSLKSMRSAKVRNLIVVLAIALTTVLFTSLFTIIMSMNEAFQQSNFRQVGGYAHGGFKYLTEEQFKELKEDSLIKEWGLRRVVGMPVKEPFHKSHVEIGYSDKKQAHWMYCDPIEGRLPEEGTNEAATDTYVLELLGIEPEIGREFTVTFDVDGTEMTQTFTLCGWWEYDPIIVANHILIPESRVDSILNEAGVVEQGNDGMTGTWNMDVMFESAMHIENDIQKVLENHDYQSNSRAEGDNYIPIGVNWGYTGAQISENIDPMMVMAIVAMLILIIFTGYLIIYNVFQISVTNDIRFYGLLKTIGTTGRQLKRMIRQQAFSLSLIGIPIGLVSGWLVGSKLTPVILNRLNGFKRDVVSISPFIFALSALFALVTVMISCHKPGKVAAKVSPIEAVRYTEGKNVKKKKKKTSKGISLFSMAKANLGRSKGKTAVTILSLSLSVLLMNITVTFTDGFDMDKYLRNMVADFIIADADYFNVASAGFHRDDALPEEAIPEIEKQEGIARGGKIYGSVSFIEEFVTEEYYRQVMGKWNDKETLDSVIENMEHNEEGLLADTAQLYGMEEFALDKLKVVEGDISKLYEPGTRYIAAVCFTDDNGNPILDSHWAKVGDTLHLRYVEEFEYYNPETGKIYEEGIPEDEPWAKRAVKYKDETYQVAALVSVPSALSYRFYGADEFVLNDQTFIQDSGTDSVLLYAFDSEDEKTENLENFIKNYTEKENPQFAYESKETYVDEFENFRSMFTLLGGALSFIVGLVGVLNFFNAILTGIITRKREFAVLQSIGMTGKQLNAMLVWEGLFYALGAILFTLILNLMMGPIIGSALEGMFWFFTYHFTIMPILLITPIFVFLGVSVPLAVYKRVGKKTIVERLRDSE